MITLSRIAFYHKSASCALVVNKKGYFTLINLFSLEPGKGHAKELMQQIVDWADREQVKVILEPRQYGNSHGIPTTGLKAFYGRFGFVEVITTPISIMEREPQ